LGGAGMPLRCRPLLLGIFLAAELPVPASAWDKDGHEAIGMTAMSALEGPATAQVKHLMGGRDAVDVAAWAHKVNKKFPWTQELHFQRQPGWKCAGADLSICPDNRCIVKALKYFYGRLTGQHLVTLKWPEGIGDKLTDADCVKYLINLIGDLHQPMHLGSETDDLGRNLTVRFRGKQSSLYNMWDSEITQAIMKDSPGFWWGGWTHVERSRVTYEADGNRWAKDGVVMFDRWADETAKYLCDNVYINPVTGRKITDHMKDGVVIVDEGLYETWKRELLSKMLEAGARTAIVLNSILRHREAHELHAGTAVHGLEGEEEADTPKNSAMGRQGEIPHGIHPSNMGPMAGLMNLGIFLVVGIVFLQVMKMWQGRDVVNQANRAKAAGGAEGGKKT